MIFFVVYKKYFKRKKIKILKRSKFSYPLKLNRSNRKKIFLHRKKKFVGSTKLECRGVPPSYVGS